MEHIFADLGQPQETPPESLEAKKERWANVVTQMTKATLLNLIARINEGFDLVWHNPDLTVQEMVDGLGARAASVFLNHASTATFLVQRFPQIKDQLKVPPTEAVITYERDGSNQLTGRVTITGV